MSRRYVGPYVNFQGRAREAMEFYQKSLGGKLDLHPASGERITHARLEGDGFTIVGSDGHPSYPPTAGDNMAIALGGSDKEKLTQAFHDLAEGGRIKSPLTAQPWGVQDGYLLDRFGINWVVSIEKG